mgnify:CR=1 FL=1
MKRILLTLMVVVAGLSTIAPDVSAQTDNRNTGATKRQQLMDQWHKDMAEFRARSAESRQLQQLADSLASVQARAALRNQDFVFEAAKRITSREVLQSVFLYDEVRLCALATTWGAAEDDVEHSVELCCIV